MIGCLSVSHQSAVRSQNMNSKIGCVPKRSGGLAALVVDDDPIVLQCTGGMLKNLGFTTHMAGGGVEALALLKDSAWDLILTDYAMPVIDGYQLGQKAKAIFAVPRVVIMTGHCQAAVAQHTNDPYIDGWLFKPFRMLHLKEMLLSIGLPVDSANQSQAMGELESQPLQ